MALTKVRRGGTDTGISDSSDATAITIDSSENVGIGTTSPTLTNGKGVVIADATAARLKLCDTTTGEGASDGFQIGHSGGLAFIFNHEDEPIQFGTNNTERMRIDTNGHLLVSKTSTGIGTVGAELKATGELLATVSGDACAFLNRTSSDGSIIDFRKDGSTIGQINSISSNLAIGTGDTGLRFVSSSDQIIPVDVAGGSTKDASLDLGQGGTRMAQIFASVGSINTSDQNEKQNIETFTDAEMKVAKRISALFKKYKIKTAVTKKGDSARVHSGVIAQEVESAFKAEGLDASKYSFWCSDTWWEETEKYTDDDGEEKTRRNTYPTKEEAPKGATEKTRLGIRYEELISFICAYNEQRFASIEARITALESK